MTHEMSPVTPTFELRGTAGDAIGRCLTNRPGGSYELAFTVNPSDSPQDPRTRPGLEAAHGLRALVQRVSRASASVDGEVVSTIGSGLLVLLGVSVDDGPPEADRLADKVAALRVFPDAEGRMNEPLGD
ncbi:MAG TPA: D-aminoacyl-tRNA deacylase, partial [Solirubrobacteraceae bacterium]